MVVAAIIKISFEFLLKAIGKGKADNAFFLVFFLAFLKKSRFEGRDRGVVRISVSIFLSIYSLGIVPCVQ